MSQLDVVMLLTLLAASSCNAGTYLGIETITPPSPTASDFIAINISGNLPAPCYPTPTSTINVQGSNIAVDLVSMAPEGIACAQVLIPFRITATIGQMAAGSYTITYRLFLDGTLGGDATQTLIVAPAHVVVGVVLNSASLAPDPSGHSISVAPGSLVTIFGSGLGSSQADADMVPYPNSLGGVTVTFNDISAPIRDVIPASNVVTAQVPFEVLTAGMQSGTVNMVITFNGASAQQQVQIVPVAPGVFTIPSGIGNAAFVNPTDGSIAAPTSAAASISFPCHPISRGENGYFYVTGLGAMAPAVPDGGDGSAFQGVLHAANSPPVVWIGGVSSGCPAMVLFAGQAPGLPGVNQINITIPQCAPAGDSVMIQVQSADGTMTSPANIATIAIR